MCRRLAHDVQRRHRSHCQPGQSRRFPAPERAPLRRPNDPVEQEAGEVWRNEARQGDEGGRSQTDRHFAPVGRQVTEQAEDDRRLPAGDQCLRISHRSGDSVGIHAVRVGRSRRHRAAGERLLEHEADVLECAALALCVAHHRQRLLVRLADEYQHVGAQPRRELDAPNARALDRLDVPRAARRRPRDGDVAFA